MQPVIDKNSDSPDHAADSMPADPTLTVPRWQRWAVLLARFLSGEMIVQGIGFFSGIFLFHAFSKSDAAYYNLANSMLGMMALMSDNGVGSGIYAIGGKVWSDRRRFGELIATAFQIRRRLTFLSILAVTPLTWYLLRHNGCPVWQSAAITLMVVVGTHFQIIVSILSEVPKLHLQALRMQKLNVWMALLRIGLLASAWLAWLNTITAMLAALITSVVQSRILRHWMPPLADPDAAPHPEDRKVLVSLIKRQLPSSLYYCFYGQISLFLISLTGNVSNLADVAALSALGRLFSVIGSVMATIIYPRFSHIHEPRLLWRRYLQIAAFFGLMGAGMCLFAAIFPSQLLWLLGKNYSHLENDVLLMVAGSVLGILTSNLWALNSIRGWILSPWIHIPVSLATQAVLIYLLPVTTVRGVLWMSLLGNLPGLAINFLLTHQQVRRMSSES